MNIRDVMGKIAKTMANGFVLDVESTIVPIATEIMSTTKNGVGSDNH